MHKLFAHDDRFLIQRLRSELDALGIPYLVKNEYLGGAVGDIPWQEAMQEIWLIEKAWESKARAVVEALEAEQGDGVPDNQWQCPCCGESNDGGFAICWQCQQPLQLN